MKLAKYLFLILASEGSSDTTIFRNQVFMKMEFSVGLIVYTLSILNTVLRALVNVE